MNTDDSHTYLMSPSGRIFSAFCRGRLLGEPAADYGLAETAAHALGVDSVGQSLPSLTQVAAAVAQLLAEPAAVAPKPGPEKSAVPQPARKNLSLRVVDLLLGLGFDPGDFHARGRTSPSTLRALAARRVVVLSLYVAGMGVDEIASSASVDPWTVRAHLRAARRRQGA